MTSSKSTLNTNCQPVVFSMGDPNGIGPEVLLKALRKYLADGPGRALIFGVSDYLESLTAQLELSLDWDRIEIRDVGKHRFPPDWGQSCRDAGQIAFDSLRESIRFCRESGAPLLVTAPVNKKSLQLAGFSFPGQTEFLGSELGTKEGTMAFLSKFFHLLLVTTHIPFQQVSEELNVERLMAKSELFWSALRRLGCDSPRIAVCGLNPHASEGGLFGHEESEIIEPAIRLLNERFGPSTFTGPYPPDTLFSQAIKGHFDGVVALYHDQGLIPLKLVAFDSAVNATLGLPMVRTSPDHGTAFDIAGKGIADPGSMISAIEWGIRLAGLVDSD